MNNYVVISRIGEGAHGVVLKGRHLETGDIVALKKIPLRKLDDGIPNTALREIKALQTISVHPNIVNLREVFPHGLGFVLVFDYMYTDLSELLRYAEAPLSESNFKSYLLMLLHGVDYMHCNNIMHRDLKPANLLIDLNGTLKIADFGLARVYSKEEGRLYSHQVATRWYRAPELLYGARKYTLSVDLWAVGCTFGELINNSPLFPGENDIEQLWLVIKVLGTPTEYSWPERKSLPDYNKINFANCEPVAFEDILLETSPQAVDLLKQFLCYQPSKRISAAQALLHEYFITEPLPVHHTELPRLSSSSRGGPALVPKSYESFLDAPLSSIITDWSFFEDAAAFSLYK